MSEYDPAADDWTPPPVQRGDRDRPDDPRLRELVRAGVPTADIMAELGCPKQRVYRMRARLGAAAPTTLQERVTAASQAAAAARAAKRAAFCATLRRATFPDACAAAGYTTDRGHAVLAAVVRADLAAAHREHPTHLTPTERREWNARRVRASWETRRARTQR